LFLLTKQQLQLPTSEFRVEILTTSLPQSKPFPISSVELQVALSFQLGEETPPFLQVEQKLIQQKYAIRYIEALDIVIIQLEMKNVFKTEEILSCLFPDDAGAQLFAKPSSDSQRNYNGKYKFYQWLQNLAETQPRQAKEIVDWQTLVERIRHVTRIKYAAKITLEAVRLEKFTFVPLIKHCEQISLGA